MNFVRLVPVFVSAVLAVVHFLRAGNLPLVLVSLAIPGVLALRWPWAARLVQAALVLMALEGPLKARYHLVGNWLKT